MINQQRLDREKRQKERRRRLSAVYVSDEALRAPKATEEANDIRRSIRSTIRPKEYPFSLEVQSKARVGLGRSQKELNNAVTSTIVQMRWNVDDKGKEEVTYQLSDGRYVTDSVLKSTFKSRANVLIGDYIESCCDDTDPFADWSSDEVKTEYP